jgi:hypothetical protein
MFFTIQNSQMRKFKSPKIEKSICPAIKGFPKPMYIRAMKLLVFIFLLVQFPLIGQNTNSAGTAKLKKKGENPLSYEEMLKLADLPLHCVNQEYPNKLNQILADSSHLKSPQELHPIFYGCFDWHSACHGFWLLTKAMNAYPGTELEKKVIKLLDQKLTDANVEAELAYFQPKLNQSFERTYGWAWLLKLHAELNQSKHNRKHKWTNKLQPLTEHIVKGYHNFLPKLVYPIRVGEHTNTAFGLTLAYEYAMEVRDEKLELLIAKRAQEFFSDDKNCPISYEPSGFDFISPCLQEAHLMSKILPQAEFQNWINRYLPQLTKSDFKLEPGKVWDRTDGKLVHVDGLNFSRAWCLIGIGQKLGENQKRLNEVAQEHIEASKSQVVGSDYMGSHWLASFLVYALFSN